MNYIKKMLIYFLGSVSSALVTFLFLPIFTMKFTVADYGNYDFSYSIITMLVSVVFMEIWVSLLRFLKDDELNERVIVSNIFLICLGLIPLYVILHSLISNILNLSDIISYSILGVMLLFQNVYQYYLRAQNKTNWYIISGISITIIQSVSTILLIYVFNLGAISIVYSSILSRLLVIAILEFSNKKLLSFSIRHIKKDIIVKILKFSFPFSINAIAFYGMTNINRIFADIYLNEEANGYIAVVNKFVFVLSLVTSTFIMVWQENSFSNAKSNMKHEYYSDVLNNLLIISSVSLMIFIPATIIIYPYMIDLKFQESSVLVPLYYLATYYSVFNGYFGQIFTAEKKTKLLTYSTITGAIINTISLIITIPTMGLIGIPISLAIGTLMNSIIRYIILRRYINIVVDLRLITGSVITSLSILIYYTNFLFSYKLLLIVVFLLVVITFGKNRIYIIFKNIFKGEK